MNTYEVLLVAYKTVIVEAEDEEEAMEIARNEIGAPYEWELDEVSIDDILENNEDIEMAIEHGSEDLRI